MSTSPKLYLLFRFLNKNFHICIVFFARSVCFIFRGVLCALLCLSAVCTFFCGLSLWAGDHSSWLQIQRSRFDSRHYHIFWEVVSLERAPLRLVSTIKELLERKSRGTPLYSQTLALTSPTSGGHSVGIVRSLTQATKFVLFFFCVMYLIWVLSSCNSSTTEQKPICS
jgi:hypothetical protein